MSQTTMQAPRRATDIARSARFLNLLSGLLDGHKKKHSDRAKKEEFCAMAKAFKKATIKGKKACNRLYHNSSEWDSSLDEE
eukprot:12667933-Ditylum_brightwellii.AAC.1